MTSLGTDFVPPALYKRQIKNNLLEFLAFSYMGILYSTPAYDPKSDIPDLTGKIILVTGAYSGIGYETTKQLAAHGATVYLACRSKERMEKTITKLKEEIPEINGKSRLRQLEIDLADTHSVRRAAARFIEREDRLDVLIHNAGRLTNVYKLSREGVELTVAVNHLGVALFTQELMPILKSTAARADSDVRIVVVSSVSHRYGPAKPGFSSLEEWNSYGGATGDSFHYIKHKRYAVTKRMNLLWAMHLQKILDEENVPITIMSLHPGFILTDSLVGSSPWWLNLAGRLGFAISQEKGAYTTLFAATSSHVRESRETYRGKYLVPFGKIARPGVKDAYDPKRAKELWDATQKISAELLAKPELATT